MNKPDERYGAKPQMFRTDLWSVYGYLTKLWVSMYEEPNDWRGFEVFGVAPAAGVAVLVGYLGRAD